MALFNFNFDKPGAGVPENAPRKKGLPRLWEMFTRDGTAFWRAGMLALLGAVPYIAGVWFAVATHAVLPLLLAGVVGGAVMAPQLVGLNDTILRSLRDEPGYWWATYRRAWKRNAKASLLPGVVFGLLLGAEIFSLFHTDWSQNPVLIAVTFVGVFLLLGMALLTFTQVALLEMNFAGILRNALLLLLGYLPAPRWPCCGWCCTRRPLGCFSRCRSRRYCCSTCGCRCRLRCRLSIRGWKRALIWKRKSRPSATQA